LTRWRNRIGEKGVDWMLTPTIQAEQNAGAIDEGSAKRVAVDVTAMEKTIAYPSDGRLYEPARDQLVTLAQDAGVEFPASYHRLAARLTLQVFRYAHGKQFTRMGKVLK
jgi:IS5 family transposase